MVTASTLPNLLIWNTKAKLWLVIFFPDMLNHSPNANCFLHWRFKDRMLEVMIKAGHAIKKGDEVLFRMCAHLYLFSDQIITWFMLLVKPNLLIELVNPLLHIAIEIWEISSHDLVLLVSVEVYYSTKAILSKISGQFFFLMYAFGPCTDDNRLYEWSKQQIYGKIWFLITNGMGMHLYLVTTSFCVQGCREVF